MSDSTTGFHRSSIMVVPAAGYYCRPNLPSLIDENEDFELERRFSSKILVIEAEDLLRIRARIASLYADKNVIVSPCQCKLYISRQSCVIDSDGKTSPDWFYFASGVIALVHSSSPADLTLALFDTSSIRLLWCLKWADHIVLEHPTTNFHVLNTSSHTSEHVGILYENKNVAELMRSAIQLMTSELNLSPYQKNLKHKQQTDKGKGKSLLRSLSLKSRKTSRQNSQDDQELSSELSVQPESNSQRVKPQFLSQIGRRRTVETIVHSSSSPRAARRPVLREIGRSRTVIGVSESDAESFNSDNLANSRHPVLHRVRKQNSTDSTDSSSTIRYDSSPEFPGTSAETKVLRRLSRPGSFIVQAHRKSSENNPPDSIIEDLDQSCELRNTDVSTKQESSTTSRVRHLFQRSRRISRSQSLKLPKEPQSHGAEENEQSRYQRSTKLQKPRAGTDTLLLHGSFVKCVIDTGHMARYARERKQWMRNLNHGHVESTDLCVTEL